MIHNTRVDADTGEEQASQVPTYGTGVHGSGVRFLVRHLSHRARSPGTQGVQHVTFCK